MDQPHFRRNFINSPITDLSLFSVKDVPAHSAQNDPFPINREACPYTQWFSEIICQQRTFTYVGPIGISG